MVQLQHIPANFKDFNFKRSVDRRSSGLVLGTSAFAPRDCEIPHSDQFLKELGWRNWANASVSNTDAARLIGSSPIPSTNFKCIGERSLAIAPRFQRGNFHGFKSRPMLQTFNYLPQQRTRLWLKCRVAAAAIVLTRYRTDHTRNQSRAGGAWLTMWERNDLMC